MRNVTTELLRTVPAPTQPRAAGTPADFARIELSLGLTLPADFKAIINAYGDGRWLDFWSLLNPFGRNSHLNLVTQARATGDSGKNLLSAERYKKVRDSDYPHPIWPEPEGLFPWALTDNGGRFFWITAGEPNTWETVYYPSRDPDYEIIPYSVSEVVLGAVTRSLPLFEDELASSFNESKPFSQIE